MGAARSEGASEGRDWIGHLRDMPGRYGPVSRAFHWLLAYLLIWQCLMFIGWRLLSEEVMRGAARFGPSHIAVGVLVLMLVVPRAIWAFANRNHREPTNRALLGGLAQVGHMALYALMFAIPALGLLQAYASGKGLILWGVHLIAATGTASKGLVASVSLLHRTLGWTVAVLAGGHIGMALVHQYVLRDGLIGRMLGKSPAA